MSNYRIIDRIKLDSIAERNALIAGLFARPASIPPKYFYDEVGCALFCAICELPEYYPTRTEVAIFRDYRQEIAHAAGDRQAAGGPGRRRLLQSRVVAALSSAAPLYRGGHCPRADQQGIVRPGARIPGHRDAGHRHRLCARAGFACRSAGLAGYILLSGIEHRQLFAGRGAGISAQIRAHCARPGSGLLIGVDGKKDKRRLEAAYDDAVGVTAAFNRNVLAHVNRLLDSDFRPEAFAHRGFYNDARGGSKCIWKRSAISK